MSAGKNERLILIDYIRLAGVVIVLLRHQISYHAVVIAVSSISYFGFEKPLNKLIRNKFGKSPTTVPAQVGEERVAVAV